MGCYFSTNANMMSNMDKINAVPKGRIFVESDGPYSKVEGKKYEPSYLLREYELITKHW